MASDDQTDVAIESYGQNKCQNMYHMTQCDFYYSDLLWSGLDLDLYLGWRLHSYGAFI